MIYNYQQASYQKLFRTAIAHKLAIGKKLPIQPRFHKLVVGPSGSGKTHLARRVGDIMNWRVLTINMASWIVLGARETPTWHYIGEWLSESEPDTPQMIILDEIDKVSGAESWTRYLRAEVYALIDGLVPEQVRPKNIDEASFREAIQNTLIFGCGAFQDAFESKDSVGFISSPTTPSSSNDLSKHLARELVNRFNTEIIILPDLKKEDYEEMIETVIPELPKNIRSKVTKIAKNNIDQAIIDKAGARFIENIVSDAFLSNVDGLIEEFERNEAKDEHQKQKEEILREENTNDGVDPLDDLWDLTEEALEKLSKCN
jgi:AAA+ superfamily predicted ATPase